MPDTLPGVPDGKGSNHVDSARVAGLASPRPSPLNQIGFSSGIGSGRTEAADAPAQSRTATRPSTSDSDKTPPVSAGSTASTNASVRASGVFPPSPPAAPASPFAPPIGCSMQSALQWLLSAELVEVRRCLSLAKAQRPSLFQGLVDEEDGFRPAPQDLDARAQPLRSQSYTLPASSQEPEFESITEEDLDALRKSDAAAMTKELPLVQFTAAVYFCDESEDHMVVDVSRLGSQNMRSEVHFTTEDATALADVRYEKTAGKLVFEPGELQKEIRVPLYYTPDWETTTEFVVKLLKDPAPVGCRPGRYLHTARVKILDMDTFPSAKFQQAVQDETMAKVSKWSLLFSYIALNWKDPIVKRGTIKMIITDVLHNLYFLSTFLMNVFLVDNIIESGGEDVPLVPLLIIGVLFVVPFAFLSLMDGRKFTYRVTGASRGMLQKALIRKFLNYGERFRQQLYRGDIVMAMTRDSVCLVHQGYMSAIEMLRAVSQIFVVLSFNVLAPFLFGVDFTPIPFIVAFVFPLLMLSVLVCRREVTLWHLDQTHTKEDALVAQVDRIVTNYRIIADYNRRPFFVNRYETCINEYNKAHWTRDKVLKDNLYFSKWLTCLFVAFYTVMGGMQAWRGGIGVGMFLANISVINMIGSTMESIYSILLEMQSTFPAMLNITTLLNAPIDLGDRMAINRCRREATTSLRTALLGDFDVGLPIDRMTIKAVNLSIDCDPSRSFNCRGQLEIRQGQLVSLVGPKGEGKSTLLKVLGGVILPKPSELFVPSHLRVLHISSEPLFFKGSLFENLTFGVACDEDGTKRRVSQICGRLRLPEPLLKVVALDEHAILQPWNEVLSYTQRCLLCLGRALIANPEVMCIHKPTMPFDEKSSINIFSLLREFCHGKGVEMDVATRHLRRPRTCIMTSSKFLGVKMSDQVYVMSQKDGIRCVDKNLVEEHMLY